MLGARKDIKKQIAKNQEKISFRVSYANYFVGKKNMPINNNNNLFLEIPASSIEENYFFNY